MKRFKGFTLIELLIVVAIIAILAAIAVPNFLEAQIRSKVSRAKADLRSLSTALESYMVDNNDYVMSVSGNGSVAWGSMKGSQSERNRLTFLAPGWNFSAGLTTPIQYISTIPVDPFVGVPLAFGYANADQIGFITWSYGPDMDSDTKGDIEPALSPPTFTTWAVCTVYNPYVTNPTEVMVCNGYTYDTSNGSQSNGDIWRIKE